nr:MAG TPA: hypothetical protein [Caudoviricetes sp.]
MSSLSSLCSLFYLWIAVWLRLTIRLEEIMEQFDVNEFMDQWEKEHELSH